MDESSVLATALHMGMSKSGMLYDQLRRQSQLASSSIGIGVNVFLLGDAVTATKKGQMPPEGYYNLEKMLSDLLRSGAKILACGTCLNARAISKEDLVEGIEVGTMIKLASWIKESYKVLSF